MKIRRKPGYSKETRKLFLPDGVEIRLISQELTPVYVWENDKPTTQVKNYRAWFTSPEVEEPFTVSFENKFDLPSYLSKVKISSFEGCEVGKNVYFRGSGLEVVK